MPGVISDPRQLEDRIVEINMGSTDNTATRGDYISFSGKQAVAAATGLPAAAYFPHSGIGIAIDQNPVWVGPDQSASANGKMRVARGGIFRVSAATANYSAGQYCFPVEVGSGIVGQTGRTGKASLWSATAVLAGLVSAVTAIVFSASGNATNVVTGTAYYERYTINPTSAVGQIVRVITNAATGQLDIILFPPLVLAAPIVNRG